ncbi:MAG: hypothetical protein ACFFCS_09590 [Candidatus Hodarchaeota archaeon]
MEFNKNTYSNSITSKCWVCTPLDGGWKEIKKLDKNGATYINLTTIFDMEMQIGDMPAWVNTILPIINDFPICGHYLFPKSIDDVLDGIRDEKPSDFIATCFTALPDRKESAWNFIKILKGWLSGDDPSSHYEHGVFRDIKDDNQLIVDNIYSCLGDKTEEKAIQVQRLVNQLEESIATTTWKDLDRNLLSKEELAIIEKYSDEGSKEEMEEANFDLEYEIKLNKEIDDCIIDNIHSTWMCAPKLFRFLERILMKIGKRNKEIFPSEITFIDKPRYAAIYREITEKLETFIEEKKEIPELGEYTIIKEWLIRILLLKFKLYQEYAGFNNLFS